MDDETHLETLFSPVALSVRAHSGRSDPTDLCQMGACNQGKEIIVHVEIVSLVDTR